tara:strand:- start:62 stop:508 length:447 start_codon:yes stop_codon:yes gene_type:complete
MRKILFLSLSLLFAGEMEVDGNLKVTGQIDASNQRIKNVGPPTDMMDAVNAQTLQDALRNDENYEYKIYMTKFYSGSGNNDATPQWKELVQNVNGNIENWESQFHNEMFILFLNGWILDNTIDYSKHSGSSGYGNSYQMLIFKRLIGD